MKETLKLIQQAKQESERALKRTEDSLKNDIEKMRQRTTSTIESALRSIEQNTLDVHEKYINSRKKQAVSWSLAATLFCLVIVIGSMWYSTVKIEQANEAYQRYRQMRAEGVTATFDLCGKERVPCVLVDRKTISSDEFYRHRSDDSMVFVPISER